MIRRRLLAGIPAALAAASIPAKAAPVPKVTFYSTLDAKQKASFDRLRAIVEAQANGTWVEPPSPDAALLGMCAEFQRLHAEGADESNPAWEKADSDAWELHDDIAERIALTDAGHRAKAHVAVALLSLFHEGREGGDPEAVFALGMLRDWLGVAA